MAGAAAYLNNIGAIAQANAAAAGFGIANANNPQYNWQATKHTLKERFSFLCCNEILSDIHFIVGRGNQQQVEK